MIFFRSVLFLCPMVCVLAQTPPETVVLKVGDVKLTAAQFDAIADSLPEPTKAFAQGSGRRQFADEIAKVLVLAAEGHRRKLDETPEFQIQSKYRAEELLANLAQAAIVDSVKVDAAALRGYYEAHMSEFERVRARHILIRVQGSPVPLKPGTRDLTDAEALAKAQALLLKIKAGGDFATIAASESDDTASSMNGGDLGWFPKGQMVPTFEEAAFQLKPGQISGLVRSPFGYHIIKVEGHQWQGFDEVKGEIEAKMRPQETQKALDALRNGVQIDYDATFFGPAKR
jgi:peptidyl-prolyl cis-trans isomerase C